MNATTSLLPHWLSLNTRAQCSLMFFKQKVCHWCDSLTFVFCRVVRMNFSRVYHRAPQYHRHAISHFNCCLMRLCWPCKFNRMTWDLQWCSHCLNQRWCCRNGSNKRQECQIKSGTGMICCDPVKGNRGNRLLLIKTLLQMWWNEGWILTAAAGDDVECSARHDDLEAIWSRVKSMMSQHRWMLLLCMSHHSHLSATFIATEQSCWNKTIAKESKVLILLSGVSSRMTTANGMTYATAVVTQPTTNND